MAAPRSNNSSRESNWLNDFYGRLQGFLPAPSRMVFSTAFLWHSLAVRSFILSPFNTLRAVTMVRPVSFTSAEVLQYLGGLNIGYAWLALQALLSARRDVAGRKRAALVLSIVTGTVVFFLY